MTDAERAICVHVVDALEEALASSNDTWGFDIEVERETVTLRGRVRDAATLALIEDIVGDVGGVTTVVNRLVVEP